MHHARVERNNIAYPIRQAPADRTGVSRSTLSLAAEFPRASVTLSQLEESKVPSDFPIVIRSLLSR